MTKLEAYQLDIEKLRRQLGDAAYIFSFIGITEEHEHFEQLKPFLIIPEKPKSLDELKQEFEDKFEELLVKTKRKFAVSQQSAEYRYNNTFKLINDNFEYAKTYGYFRPKLTLYGVDGSLLISQGDGLSWVTPNVFSYFEIKLDKNPVGYWDVPPNAKIWLKKKPNRIVRYFSKLLLNFEWKDNEL